MDDSRWYFLMGALVGLTWVLVLTTWALLIAGWVS